MAHRIEDYALIGDCHTAALVAKDGSIDWCCFPRFDSGACFAAILGTKDHGRWQICPDAELTSVRRQYNDGSIVLETEFETKDGAVTLIDFMPPRTREPVICRLVVGRRGRVKMKMELIIRFDYGSAVPWVRQCDDLGGVRATAGDDTLFCRTPIKLEGKGMTTVAEFEVGEGDRVPFTLAYSDTYQAKEAERIDVEKALEETNQWWREWSGKCTYEGHSRPAVLRSLITLKALTYAPTGGIVAAPTTSLPERIGGERNWDYRYCWIRDASFSLLSLSVGGYKDEALAWREWLINAIAGAPEDTQIMYGVAGERRLPESLVDTLPGYENSRPVRIGNGAYRQRQLDIYGEVIAALWLARKLGLPESKQGWQIEKQLIDFVMKIWREPDSGLWESRGPLRHYTQSKVMAWVALDRAIESCERFRLDDGDLPLWKKTRDEIHAEVCAKGFNPAVNAFTQYYGSADPDASLLMLSLVGFLPPTDPRMLGTIALIEKQLVRDGFVQRYPTPPDRQVDGLHGGEGVFLICTFWLVSNLAMIGRQKEAEALFDRLAALRNDVGLLSEEYDPAAKRMLGNFPQAFSHIGLINSARKLSQPEGPDKQRSLMHAESR